MAAVAHERAQIRNFQSVTISFEHVIGTETVDGNEEERAMGARGLA
jgi:hypothetical protein